MKRWSFALLLAAAAVPSSAQDFTPPEAVIPDEAVLKSLQGRADVLARAIATLRRQGLRDPWLADLDVHHQAVVWLLELKEFYTKDYPSYANDVVDRGLLRAQFASRGEFPWATAIGQTVVRGYRSRIDNTVQPYAVTLPANYGREPGKKWRVDVVLHGRNKTLTEVGFVRNNSDKAAPADLDHVRIDIFGRGNNAYRWAGETDVFEAIEHFFKVEKIVGRDQFADSNRVVLRGFSMGGAGTWHIGLHFPDRWCVIGPGAGFTTTHGYAKAVPDQLPDYQEACLKIYDALDYAENAFNVPIVAYSGEIDAQKLAADNIENRLKQLNIPMTHIVAPGLAHSFPPDWVKKVNVFWSKHATAGRPEYPKKVSFVTYTMKYPSCYWVEILGLDRHYQQARVDAEEAEDHFKVKTANVRLLHLTLPAFGGPIEQVVIDGQKLTAKPTLMPNGNLHYYLEKRDGQWRTLLPQRVLADRARVPQKIQGLQGPVDDAFCDGFLCVRGTGKPWHEATAKYAERDLQRFEREWAKFFRGNLPIKNDTEIDHDDIAGKNLILFGDPSSNTLIAQVADALPLTWTKDVIAINGVKVPAADHVPVMIYPNPLNASRYVVLNSGHTFHAPEYQGTNALLFPRLGDFAVLKVNATDLKTETATAGLFDEYWKLPASK